jgi:hypothetical protein
MPAPWLVELNLAAFVLIPTDWVGWWGGASRTIIRKSYVSATGETFLAYVTYPQE